MLETILVFVLLLCLNSAECVGFYSATYFDFVNIARQPGFNFHLDKKVPDRESKMILWFVRYASLRVLGEFWSKPVCTCLPCMGSLHSFALWGFIYTMWPFCWLMLPLHAIYILCLCGINRLVVAKFDL